jgi:hypothetical protein
LVSFSNHGIGVMIHGIEPQLDGRVEFTSWLCVFWLPLLPLRSWTAIYTGQDPPNGINDEPYQFADLRRVPHDWVRIYLTFTRSMLVVACAIAPTYIMINRVSGRGATRAEMVVVFASAFWAVAVMIWAEHVRRRRLQGK